MHDFFLFKTVLFEIEQDSLVFKGESPSATLEICPKIVHWEIWDWIWEQTSLSPNVMVPRHISDTFSPDFPRNRYPSFPHVDILA